MHTDPEKLSLNIVPGPWTGSLIIARPKDEEPITFFRNLSGRLAGKFCVRMWQDGSSACLTPWSLHHPATIDTVKLEGVAQTDTPSNGAP